MVRNRQDLYSARDVYFVFVKPHPTLTRLPVLPYSFNPFVAYETNQCKCHLQQTFDLGSGQPCDLTTLYTRRYSVGNLHFFFHTQREKLPNLGSNSWFSLPLCTLYMCHLCVSVLDPGRVALAWLPKWQPPIHSELRGILVACHRCALLILIANLKS